VLLSGAFSALLLEKIVIIALREIILTSSLILPTKKKQRFLKKGVKPKYGGQKKTFIDEKKCCSYHSNKVVSMKSKNGGFSRSGIGLSQFRILQKFVRFMQKKLYSRSIKKTQKYYCYLSKKDYLFFKYRNCSKTSKA